MNHQKTQALLRLKIKKLHRNAVVPQYATAGAACFDLHTIGHSNVHLMPGDSVSFPTGLSFEVPRGYAMLIFSRSGHGFKNDVRLANCVGVIDSDYRGEVMVKLTNDHPFRREAHALVVHPGDRIAQAMLVPAPYVDLEPVDELSDTARGAGGFGSTGQGSANPEQLRMSDREWAAQPAGLREGCTVHVPGVGDL